MIVDHASTPSYEAHYSYVGTHSDVQNGENAAYVFHCCKKDVLRKLDDAVSIMEFIVRWEQNSVRESLLEELKELRSDLSDSFKNSMQDKSFTAKKDPKDKKG